VCTRLCYFFFLLTLQPPLGVVFYSPLVGFSLLAYEVSWSMQRRATVGRTPLNEWSVRRRDLYLTTHNTHNTHIHALGGIRAHDLSRRAAVDLRLRPRGHWDRHVFVILMPNSVNQFFFNVGTYFNCSDVFDFRGTPAYTWRSSPLAGSIYWNVT